MAPTLIEVRLCSSGSNNLRVNTHAYSAYHHAQTTQSSVCVTVRVAVNRCA